MGFFVCIRACVFRPPRKVDYWMDGIANKYFNIINNSTYLEVAVITVLVLDALITCISVANQQTDTWTYAIITGIFYGLYFLECAIRLCDEKASYWKSKMNCFDFFILFLIAFQLCEGLMTSVTMIFLAHQLVNLRFLRLFRLSKHVEGLALVIQALMDTIVTYSLNVFILLVLFMYVFGVLGNRLFGKRQNPEHDIENWGSMSSAFFSLFAYTTMDDWLSFHEILEKKGYVYVARVFGVSYILIVGFVVMSSLRAIVISNISRMKQEQDKRVKDEDEQRLSRKHQRFVLRQRQVVSEMYAREIAGESPTFEETAKDYLENRLVHDDFTIWRDMCGCPIWMFTFLQTLDYQDTVSYRLQHFHLEMAGVLLQLVEASAEEPKMLAKRGRGSTRSVTPLPLRKSATKL